MNTDLLRIYWKELLLDLSTYGIEDTICGQGIDPTWLLEEVAYRIAVIDHVLGDTAHGKRYSDLLVKKRGYDPTTITEAKLSASEDYLR